MRQANGRAIGAAMIVAGLLGACAAMVDQAPPSPPVTYACYWMTQDGQAWVEFPSVPSKKDCFQLDSCSGGAGASGGGCYKWAAGPDAPAQPW